MEPDDANDTERTEGEDHSRPTSSSSSRHRSRRTASSSRHLRLKQRHDEEVLSRVACSAGEGGGLQGTTGRSSSVTRTTFPRVHDNPLAVIRMDADNDSETADPSASDDEDDARVKSLLVARLRSTRSRPEADGVAPHARPNASSDCLQGVLFGDSGHVEAQDTCEESKAQASRDSCSAKASERIGCVSYPLVAPRPARIIVPTDSDDGADDERSCSPVPPREGQVEDNSEDTLSMSAGSPTSPTSPEVKRILLSKLRNSLNTGLRFDDAGAQLCRETGDETGRRETLPLPRETHDDPCALSGESEEERASTEDDDGESPRSGSESPRCPGDGGGEVAPTTSIASKLRRMVRLEREDNFDMRLGKDRSSFLSEVISSANMLMSSGIPSAPPSASTLSSASAHCPTGGDPRPSSAASASSMRASSSIDILSPSVDLSLLMDSPGNDWRTPSTMRRSSSFDAADDDCKTSDSDSDEDFNAGPHAPPPLSSASRIRCGPASGTGMRWLSPEDIVTRVTSNGWRLPVCPPRAGHCVLTSDSARRRLGGKAGLLAAGADAHSNTLTVIGGRCEDGFDSGVWEMDYRSGCWWERDVVVRIDDTERCNRMQKRHRRRRASRRASRRDDALGADGDKSGASLGLEAAACGEAALGQQRGDQDGCGIATGLDGRRLAWGGAPLFAQEDSGEADTADEGSAPASVEKDRMRSNNSHDDDEEENNVDDDDVKDSAFNDEDVTKLSYHSVVMMLTQRGNVGVMFGGYTGHGCTVDTVVLVSDIDKAPTVPVTMTIVSTTAAEVEVEGESIAIAAQPCSRCLHSATPLSEYLLLVFGGWHRRSPNGVHDDDDDDDDDDDGDDDGVEVEDDDVGVFLNDCYTLNTVQMRWTVCPPAEGCRPPGPRCGHTAVAIAGRVYVFGGETPHGQTNQLYVYDHAARSWSFEEHMSMVNSLMHREAPGAMPMARSGHAAVKVGSQMIVHGGFNNEVGALHDTHVLDVAARRWTEIVPDFMGPARASSRLGAGDISVYKDESEWGCPSSSGVAACDDRDADDEEGRPSSEDEGDGDTEESEVVYCPPARTGHAVGVVGLRMYVHGGYDADGNMSGDLIALDTAILPSPNVVLRGEALDEYEAMEMPRPTEDSDELAIMRERMDGRCTDRPASSCSSSSSRRRPLPKLSLSLRHAFQFFISREGAPFVAIKTARDLRQFRPNIDDMGAVIGVSCSVLCGNDPVGVVSPFVQSAELKPDPFLLATCRMLLVRQEATFTNLSLRRFAAPMKSDAVRSLAKEEGKEEQEEEEAPGATLRLSRTHVRVKVGDDVLLKEPYHPSFAMLVKRPENTDVLMQLNEQTRYIIRSRTVQERDLIVLVARSFFALQQRLML